MGFMAGRDLRALYHCRSVLVAGGFPANEDCYNGGCVRTIWPAPARQLLPQHAGLVLAGMAGLHWAGRGFLFDDGEAGVLVDGNRMMMLSISPSGMIP